MEGKDWSSVPAPGICRAGSAAREGAGGGKGHAQALLKFVARGTGDQTPLVLSAGATALPVAMEKPWAQHTLPQGCS